MESFLALMNQYWWAVVLAVAFVMKVLNKITTHFSEHKGVVQWCLFIVDILDVIKSTPPPEKGEGQ